MSFDYSPDEISFCLHNGELLGEPKELTIITFCPITYWEQNECLPDFHFGKDIWGDKDLPKGYSWFDCCEETAWMCGDLPEDIRTDLIRLGFVENKELQDFLTNCMNAI